MKNIFTLLLFLCSLNLTNAQQIEWQNTIGGSENDIPTCIMQTADGGYILGGISYSNISGDKTENSNGDSDFWIVKIDAVGIIQWQNAIGGIDRDDLTSIQQTNDGGYILGGNSKSNISGDKTENCQGWRDYWILKTDATGNIQWQNTIGGDGEDLLSIVQQTTDGGYILGGTSWSTISGDKTENNSGLDDYWLVKTDALGNIQWQNTIGGLEDEQMLALQQTSDGGYILGGGSNSNISGDKSENCMGVFDMWIVKTDSLGNLQWQNTIGGNEFDALIDIRQTIDGGYIVGGYSWSEASGDKTENSNGGWDYWILKTDTSGNIQWQNTIGGLGHDYLASIRQTIDGGYILGGDSRSDISGDKTEDRIGGAGDFWIVKTNATGTIQWQNTIGGIGGDEYAKIRQTTDGGYIVLGPSSSNISGDKTENSNGFDDYWVIKLDDKYNFITGKLFIDSNSNNMQDPGESSVSNTQVTEFNSGSIGFSNQNGHYNISVIDSGNFTVSPDPLNYYNTTPLSHSVYFPSVQQTDSLNDFAFQPTGVFNDLEITITPLSPFRPGFDAYYNLHYKNVGTTSLTGTVLFYPDTALTYVSASVVPTFISQDSVVWQAPLLDPYDEGDILITVNVSNGVFNGYMVNSSAKIEPVAGDETPVNNQAWWEVIVTGSIDPNDILVNRTNITTTELINYPWLEYIIRFQNTGTDTAFNIRVINPLDTLGLNLNTFELVSASHPVNVSWRSWERNMEFQFNNVLLPDSNANEPLSHGFVRYRIKPKTTLAAGDSIINNAHIYFDFNSPVATNSVVTYIVLPTNVSTNDPVINFSIYPNPTTGTITITGDVSEANEFILYDLSGRVVLNQSLYHNTSIDLSEIPPALYFYEIRFSNMGKTYGKIIKQF